MNEDISEPVYVSQVNWVSWELRLFGGTALHYAVISEEW